MIFPRRCEYGGGRLWWRKEVEQRGLGLARRRAASSGAAITGCRAMARSPSLDRSPSPDRARDNKAKKSKRRRSRSRSRDDRRHKRRHRSRERHHRR